MNSCSLDRFGGGVALGAPFQETKTMRNNNRGGNLDLPLFQFLKHFFRLIVDDFLRSFPYVYISRLGPRGKNTKSKSRKSTSPSSNNRLAVDYWNHCADAGSLVCVAFAARHFGISWHSAAPSQFPDFGFQTPSQISPRITTHQYHWLEIGDSALKTQDWRLGSVELLSWQTCWQRQMLLCFFMPSRRKTIKTRAVPVLLVWN